MRTVTFQSVLHGVAHRMGIESDSTDPGYNLLDSTARTLTEYINTAYKVAWEFWPWPDSLTIEQRTAVAQEIAEDQSGETFIGEMLAIYMRDPRTASNPGPVAFEYHQGGWFLKDSSLATSTVYCQYRPAINYFTAEPYDNSTAYIVGNTVYYATSGDCYRCIQAGTGNLPTDDTFWSKIPFMASLRDAVIASAYAESLAEDGQVTASAIYDQRAQEFLNHEVDLLEQQGQGLGFTVQVRAAVHG